MWLQRTIEASSMRQMQQTHINQQTVKLGTASPTNERYGTFVCFFNCQSGIRNSSKQKNWAKIEIGTFFELVYSLRSDKQTLVAYIRTRTRTPKWIFIVYGHRTRWNLGCLANVLFTADTSMDACCRYGNYRLLSPALLAAFGFEFICCIRWAHFCFLLAKYPCTALFTYNAVMHMCEFGHSMLSYNSHDYGVVTIA